MRLGTIDEYVRDSFVNAPSASETASALEDTLAPEEIRDQFPYSVVVEADFPEWDVANRWCWQTFGPRNGLCEWTSEYPACPIILAAPKVVKIDVHAGQEYKYLAYSNPFEHSHSGLWTTMWFGKTDYDHGFGAFYFSNQNDKIRFIEQVPEIDLGEKYT